MGISSDWLVIALCLSAFAPSRGHQSSVRLHDVGGEHNRVSPVKIGGGSGCPFGLPERDPLQGVHPEPCRSPQPGKYVLFDKDPGQIGDITDGFVMAAAVACASGRTLVLPPASAWWMFDWGPTSYLGQLDQKDGQFRMPNTTSRLEDFFNIYNNAEGLKSTTLSVLSFKEFVSREGARLTLPWKNNVKEEWLLAKTQCKAMRMQFAEMELYEGDTEVRADYWIAYIKAHCESLEDEIASNLVDLQEFGMKHFQTLNQLRCPLSNPSTLNSDHAVLYFPNDPYWFSERYSYKRLADCGWPTKGKIASQYQLMKQHIGPSQVIARIAQKIRQHLGGPRQFFAFHFALHKSDEFDRKKVDDAPRLMASYWHSFSVCARVGSRAKLYVATDANKSWFGEGWPNVARLQAFFWEDVLDVIEQVLVESPYRREYIERVGLTKVKKFVEHEVAVGSAAFIGTRRFSFSESVSKALIRAGVPWIHRQTPAKCAFVEETCTRFDNSSAFTRVHPITSSVIDAASKLETSL